jgi:predicted HTH transcriptional regulator
MESKVVVLVEIPAASVKPTQFAGKEWVRVGTNKKPLKDYPELERELWRRFDHTPFEAQLAAENLSGPDALALLDYPAYFDLLKLPLPEDRTSVPSCSPRT